MVHHQQQHVRLRREPQQRRPHQRALGEIEGPLGSSVARASLFVLRRLGERAQVHDRDGHEG